MQCRKCIPDEEERLHHKECPVYVLQRTENNCNPTNDVMIIYLTNRTLALAWINNNNLIKDYMMLTKPTNKDQTKGIKKPK